MRISVPTDDLEDKHARNRDQRLEWIDQWAEFVASAEDDSEWGEKLNTLIDAQIEAAQQMDDDLLEEVISWDRYTRRPGEEASE